MDIKNLRKNLQQGKIVVGSEVNEVRSPAIAEVYAAAGLDFIVVDMEHTSFTISRHLKYIEWQEIVALHHWFVFQPLNMK